MLIELPKQDLTPLKKALTSFLRLYGRVADGVTRRELFRMAAEWMTYHAARNQTSHRYGEEMAQEVMQVMSEFGRSAQQLLIQLQKCMVLSKLPLIVTNIAGLHNFNIREDARGNKRVNYQSRVRVVTASC